MSDNYKPIDLKLPEGAIPLCEVRVMRYLDPATGRAEMAMGLEVEDDGHFDAVTIVGMLHVAAQSVLDVDIEEH